MTRGRVSTILMVEDDPADGYLIRKSLSEFRTSLDVHQAPTLAEARAFLERTGKYDGVDTPACVLVDLRLPDGSGADLIVWMASRHESRDIPVVVLTGDVENRTPLDSYPNVACRIGKPKSMEGYAALAETLGQIVVSAASGRPPSNDNFGDIEPLADPVDHS